MSQSIESYATFVASCTCTAATSVWSCAWTGSPVMANCYKIIYRIDKPRHVSAFLPPSSLCFASCLFPARRLRRSASSLCFPFFAGRLRHSFVLRLPGASTRPFMWDWAHAARLPARRAFRIFEIKRSLLDDRAFFCRMTEMIHFSVE